MIGWSDKLVAVHVEELCEAWRLGLLAFIKELEGNTQTSTAVFQPANKFFPNLATDRVVMLLGKGACDS